MEGEMLKGHFDMIVPAALSADPAHGYAVIEEIKRRSASAFELPEGTIYPALHRLERGERGLAEQRAIWEQFSAAVGGLLKGSRPWKIRRDFGVCGACGVAHRTRPPNVRGHRADEMKMATGYAASEPPDGPRC